MASKDSTKKAAYVRDWEKKNPEKVRARWLKRLHGIEWDAVLSIYQSQNGKCAICDKDITLLKTPGHHCAYLDHNHKTGSIRGLLCPQCNTGIGLLHDSPEVLLWAIQYIEQNP